MTNLARRGAGGWRRAVGSGVLGGLLATGWSAATIPGATAVPRSGAAVRLLQASYRAARAARSFEMSAADLLAGPLAWRYPVTYVVLQTPARSESVSRFELQINGQFDLLQAFQTPGRFCPWYRKRLPRGPVHLSRGCGALSASAYQATLFPYLQLTRDRPAGTRSVDGVAATGIAGHLDVVQHSQPGVGGSFDYGMVTVWIATGTRLPVAITATHRGRTVPLFWYGHWDSSALHFPPGTPAAT